MKRKVTLSEVADSAGVSVQTVSNVVNNKPIVSEGTRKRVLNHLAERGYRSNELARSLKTNKSRLIGLVVPSMSNSMYAEVAETVVIEAEQRGYTVMMAVTMRDANTELELVNTIIDHSAAGILMSPTDPGAAASTAVVKEGVPYVELLNRGLGSGCDVFEADNFEGARLAVQHLIKWGHQQIAHIAGVRNSTGSRRFEGYEQGLLEANISPSPELIVNGKYTRVGGRLACQALLDSGVTFSAIFCASDLMAYGAMEALAARGLRVPQDISVVGFDDMSLSSLPSIDLTSVSFDPASLGKKAIEQLIAIIEQLPEKKPPIAHCLADCRLMERGSVQAFRQKSRKKLPSATRRQA